MMNDLRYAVRVLLRSPRFTCAALAALALGIGATTAMFAAVNNVLLRPLPYPDAERLYVVRETRAQAGFERTVVAEGEFLAWMRDSPVIEHAAAVEYPALAVRIDAAPERIPALRVAADFFPLFGISPALGRTFTRDAEQPGQGDVIVLGHGLWRRRFGGASDAIGRAITVDGRPMTIIGVLPDSFLWSGPVDAIVPKPLGPEQAAKMSDHSLDVYARLRTGTTPEEASAMLTAAVTNGQAAPAHATGAVLVPLRQEVVGESATPMGILFASVGLVLLIACANIASLLLARATARQKEIAVRSALGATRARVVRQLVTESVLLSVAGGVIGSIVASWLSALLGKVASGSIPRAAEIGMDLRALAFALGASALCGVLFGIVPAWHSSRSDVSTGLKRESRGGTSGGTRTLATFSVAEIALALVLLVGAGLLLASVRNLRQVDPGFDTAGVLTVPAYLPAWKYTTPDAQRAFIARAVDEMAGVPGVRSAAAVNVLPLSGNNSSGAITPEGWPAPAPGDRESADRRTVTPAYFDAMGVRILQGRTFAASDDERGPRVAIVSRAFAEKYWNGSTAVGKRLKLSRYDAEAPWLTIVGVAADVRHGSLAQSSRQVVYFPHAQIPSRIMELVARSSGTPELIAPGIRAALQRIDPDLPVDGARPLAGIVRESLFDAQLELGLLGLFAAVALGLAASGIYAVMAYGIALRRQEFGIRVALGATRLDILRLVAGAGLRLTAAGIVIGLFGAWIASSALASELYGIGTKDPFVYGGTALLLAAVALAACLIPTRRAISVDPIVALRGE